MRLHPSAIRGALCASVVVTIVAAALVNTSPLFWITHAGITLLWIVAWFVFRCRHDDLTLLNVYDRQGSYIKSAHLCEYCQSVLEIEKNDE